MRTIEASEWKPGITAFLWEETGDGNLARVTHIRSDWWIVTGRNSWCCTPQTRLYVSDLHDDAMWADWQATRDDLRANLRDRRVKYGLAAKGLIDPVTFKPWPAEVAAALSAGGLS